MKKMTIFLIGILFLAEWAQAAPLRVVTTTEDTAAIAREVGGPLVEVESLTRGSQDPHFLEARPSLILKTSRADLFIEIGLGLEAGWAPAVLAAARNPAIQPGASGYLDVSRDIEPMEIPSAPVDRSQGDVHPLGNPHYWLDPENGGIVSREIARSLMSLLPDRSQVIEQNQKEFARRLDDSMVRWKDRMKPYQGVKIVTYHNSWTYFARRFGLDVIGYIEPKPGVSPSPAHLKQLMALIKQEKVKLIIMEPYFSRSIPELFSRETGAKVLVLPPSVGGAEGIKIYFDLFDYLTDRLTTALSKGS